MAGRGGSAPSAMRSGDLAIIGVGAAAFLLGLGALISVGIASFLFGGGWVWPSGVAGAFREIGALAGGHPARGLDPSDARRVAGGIPILVVLAIVETVALALAVLLVWAAAPARAVGDRTGFASRSDADGVLGLRQLSRLGRLSQPSQRQPRGWRRAGRPALAGLDRFRPARRRGGQRSRNRPAGWQLGRSRHTRGAALWVPVDRIAGVVGPSHSEETRDVLAQADLAAPGALLQVCADPDDVLLTLTRRSNGDRPVFVCDPSGLLPRATPFVWDPLAGCVDSTVATRRAGAFAAATVLPAASASGDPAGARFQAGEAAKVLQGYFHAAALTGRTLDHVMGWVADPLRDETAATILTEHPHAESHWATLLRGALRSSPNTAATVQLAMRPFMHREFSRRCMPNSRQPATDIADVLGRGGTIYLLGKDDAYASVSPLFTAITEDVLDIAERAGAAAGAARAVQATRAARSARGGRAGGAAGAAGAKISAPALTVTLDRLPATTPIPTLPQRLADANRHGLSFVWSAPNWQQLITCYGEGSARSIMRSTDVLVLLDADAPEWVKAPAWANPIAAGQAVVLVASSPPIMARLNRPADDESVRAEAERARMEMAGQSTRRPWRWDPSVAALTAARDHGLHADSMGLVTYRNFGDAERETHF